MFYRLAGITHPVNIHSLWVGGHHLLLQRLIQRPQRRALMTTTGMMMIGRMMTVQVSLLSRFVCSISGKLAIIVMFVCDIIVYIGYTVISKFHRYILDTCIIVNLFIYSVLCNVF